MVLAGGDFGALGEDFLPRVTCVHPSSSLLLGSFPVSVGVFIFSGLFAVAGVLFTNGVFVEVAIIVAFAVVNAVVVVVVVVTVVLVVFLWA